MDDVARQTEFPFRDDCLNNSNMSFSNYYSGFTVEASIETVAVASSTETQHGLFMSEEQIASVLRRMLAESLPSERNFDVRTEAVILSVFIALISFGLLGNSLVCYVVARNPRMRTPRNVFIINLAVSDLTLCLFTQPFNLVKVLTTDWRLGRVMCKVVSMVAGTNVFVSTASITAIALDRYRVIVYPTRRGAKGSGRGGGVVALALVWSTSILFACPLLVLNDISVFAPVEDVTLYEACVEDSARALEKKIYSIASMLVQYIVPIVIVSVAHAQISRKLRYRMTNRQSNEQQQHAAASNSVFYQKKSLREAKRKRKTKLLLLMISVVYAASWLPLNIFNIMADFDWNTAQACNGLLVPICHILVLCSACANPLLYGWLNENFRCEFVKALQGVPCLRRLPRFGGHHAANGRNSTTFDLTSRQLTTNATSRRQPVTISPPS